MGVQVSMQAQVGTRGRLSGCADTRVGRAGTGGGAGLSVGTGRSAGTGEDTDGGAGEHASPGGWACTEAQLPGLTVLGW